MSAAPLPLAAVAAHGLAGGGAGMPDEPLDADAWPELLRACHEHRLLGHLSAAITAGAFPATPAQAHDAVVWELHALGARSRLDRRLVDAVATLTAAGVDHRVLKGATLAQAYPDPERRHHYDNDLLARAGQLDAAVDALTAAGYRRRVPPPRPGYDRRFAKSVTFVGPDGYELDLHRTLIDGPFGFVLDADALWAEHSSVAVGDATLRGLAPPEALLHACTSAALSDSPPRWSARRDVAQLLDANQVTAEWFLDTVQLHGFGLVAATGLLLASQGLGVHASHPLVTWAATYEPTRGDRRRLRTYRDRRGFATQSVEVLVVLPGWRDRLGYTRAALAPTREFLDAYDTTRLGWLRRGGRSLRGEHPATT